MVAIVAWILLMIPNAMNAYVTMMEQDILLSTMFCVSFFSSKFLFKNIKKLIIIAPITTSVPPIYGTTEDTNGCAVSSWIGDGLCDDEANILECDYDGGDCCGEDVISDYCTSCECIEPVTNSSYCSKIDAVGDGICDEENNWILCNFDGGDCVMSCDVTWIGDSYCDDSNNNAECQYDGGDCCGPNVVLDYCSECTCKDPENGGSETESQCEKPQWIGDGFCDDETNTEMCEYDGGDCCDGNSDMSYCIQCQCLASDCQNNLMSDGVCDLINNTTECMHDGGDCEVGCLHPEWIGDGNCDGIINTAVCNFDGGDCCESFSLG